VGERVELESSAIKAVEHSAASDTVTVFFASGAQQTVPCTTELFKEFITSESPGRFWHQRLKSQAKV